MDPELIALLARIAELSADELADLNTRLSDYWAQVAEMTPSDEMDIEALAELTETVAASIAQATAETTRRADEAAAAEAAETERIAAAQARLDAARGAVTPPAGDDPAADPTVDPAADPITAGAGPTVPARRPALGSMQRQAPAGPPDSPDAGPRVQIAMTASADVRGFAVGQEINDWSEIGKALVAKMQGFSGVRPGQQGEGENVVVASARATYPTSRILVSGDADGNSAKLDAVTSDEALVAAGGLCEALPVDYTIPEIGDLSRPFRDSKARFNADRGGIRTQATPAITDADAGVGFWTLANDADPNNVGGTGVPVGDRLAAKPVIEFDCGDEVISYVYAVTLRARYNNIRARFNPERVASNARMGMVSFARLAELRLMTLQAALSTAVTSAALLGASKDFFATLDGVTARMRYRQRRARTTGLVATMPSWVLDMLRADFVRQMPTDGFDQYMVADAILAQMFSVRNVRPVWITEDLDGNATGGIGVPQTAGALLDFPDTFRWFLEYEGEVVFLDGGELDLGVVRDSSLNAVNKYETFYETFEGVHFKGAEAPLVIASTLNPNGSAAGLVATATGNASADL